MYNIITLCYIDLTYFNYRKEIQIMNALDYAKASCDTMMELYTPMTLPPEKGFHYHQGVFLSGMEKTFKLCGERKYADYIKAWVDKHVDESGVLHNCNTKTLDDFQPGILLYRLADETGDIRYEKPMHMIIEHIKNWKVNEEGGYWHKFEFENQMWLDGLYMAGPFTLLYANRFNEYELYDRVYKQLKLMHIHTTDEKTGLMYHGWDCSKKAEWADPETGCSSEFWGRAMGWYAVATADIPDWLPKDYKNRQEIIDICTKLLKSLVKYQDAETGMWYQLVDKGNYEKNWIETSCSCLYTYAIAKAIRRGYLDESFSKYVDKAYEGIINFINFENGRIKLPGVCIGTGIGDMDFYFERPTVDTDLHGMGAFILMCTEYYKFKNK